MTPAEIARNSLASWRYAIAALRARHEAGREVTPAEMVRRADEIVATEIAAE